MLRLIAATALVLHVFVMMLFAATSKQMIAAAVLACYLCLLALYFWKRAFSLLVLTGSGLYLVVILVFYGALVIGSVQIERPANIWFHSFVFLPGIAGASGYAWYVIQDRKQRGGST